MIVVGLTGGIGSGKTTVAYEFKTLGIPIYISDNEAKKIMNRSKVIKRKLTELFGAQAYVDNQLNRPYLAGKIFNDKDLLEKMNAIVHPKVARHFKNWIAKQDAPYVIKEAAILFENGSNKDCNYVITVTAPKNLRFKRLLKRDASTKSKIESIMKNQWSDERKAQLSDYVILNDTLDKTKAQVYQIHQDILRQIS